jgi:hypothetical protein
MDTNFFGPHPSGGDKNRPIFEDPKTLNIRFSNNLLHALPGRPNYLYGPLWRPKSREVATPDEFRKVSGLEDTSRSGDPEFVDAIAGNFRVKAGSPAQKSGVGVRGMEMVPVVRFARRDP